MQLVCFWLLLENPDTLPGLSQDDSTQMIRQFVAALQHFTNAVNYTCRFCEATGHEFQECPLKKRMDKAVGENGLSYGWGVVKGAAYYLDHVQSADGNAKRVDQIERQLKKMSFGTGKTYKKKT